MHELDNPAWSALNGRQWDLGRVTPLAARFHPDVAPFGAFSAQPSGDHWNQMAGLIGPEGSVALCVPTGPPPATWTVLMDIAGLLMVGDQDRLRDATGAPNGATEATDRPEPLGKDDVADMLDLVEVVRPGPFLSRTVEFGGYVGIRRHGQLIAMAGERMRPAGHAEISAVATHPDHRRQGLAQLLVRTVTAAITSRGETPFLHVAAGNTGAVDLYEQLGFTLRREVRFVVVQAPAD